MQAFDTPLHFASKFGAVKVIEILLSHGGCDLDKENKLAQKASDIICQRKGSEEDKRVIKSLLNKYKNGKKICIEKPHAYRSLDKEFELKFENLSLT